MRTVSPAAGNVCRGGLGGLPPGCWPIIIIIRMFICICICICIGLPPGFSIGQVDVRAVGLEHAHQGHIRLIGVLERDRQPDGRSIFLGGLGELLDHEVGGDREVAAEPHLGRGFPAGFRLAGSQRDAQAVGFPREVFLFAVALGVERRLIEFLGAKRPRIIGGVVAAQQTDQAAEPGLALRVLMASVQMVVMTGCVVRAALACVP